MLLRWIGQKPVFPTTCLDGTHVVLVHPCVLLCGEKTPQAQFSGPDMPV